jgi:hypothetical protein
LDGLRGVFDLLYVIQKKPYSMQRWGNNANHTCGGAQWLGHDDGR